MYKHLTLHQVYYIWLNCVNNLIKMKVNDVATKLGKHRFTIYRAIKYIKKTNWDPTQLNAKLRKRNKEGFKIISPKIKNIYNKNYN